MRTRIVPRFEPSLTRRLRDEFDRRFKDPKRVTGERFVWDHWEVPGQYRLLRTPAAEIFAPKDFELLVRGLKQWGLRNLGCRDISPLWLSCYLEGSRQELHADLPHGPWAFVLSLTQWERRKFTGGETQLLTESALDYWGGGVATRARARSKGLEAQDFIELVAPKFGQLAVFDPRIPHGVREVRGVHDVCEGRLVVHGWFTQAEPSWIDRADPRKQGQDLPAPLRPALGWLGEILGQEIEGLELSGHLAVKLSCVKGKIGAPQLLVNGLRDLGETRVSVRPAQIERAILHAIDRWRRDASSAQNMRKGASRLSGEWILPLSFVPSA